MALKIREIEQRFNDSYDKDSKDYLMAVNFSSFNDESSIMRLHSFGPEASVDIWLDRGQVEDLMVVLGYWLQETKEE